MDAPSRVLNIPNDALNLTNQQATENGHSEQRLESNRNYQQLDIAICHTEADQRNHNKARVSHKMVLPKCNYRVTYRAYTNCAEAIYSMIQYLEANAAYFARYFNNS